MTTKIPLATVIRHRPRRRLSPEVAPDLPFSYSSQSCRDRRSELLEVFRIPSVNGIDLRFQSATSDQGVIDRAANDTRLSGFLDRGMVLVAGERDERKALANVLQKEQHLLAAQAVSPGEPSHRRVDFGQAVSGAAIPLFIGVYKGLQASLVMFVIFHKDRNQHRGIEERSQWLCPRFRSSRSRRTCWIVSSTVEADSGSPEWNTQTPRFFLSCAVPRSGRRVIRSS